MTSLLISFDNHIVTLNKLSLKKFLVVDSLTYLQMKWYDMLQNNLGWGQLDKTRGAVYWYLSKLPGG